MRVLFLYWGYLGKDIEYFCFREFVVYYFTYFKVCIKKMNVVFMFSGYIVLFRGMEIKDEMFFRIFVCIGRGSVCNEIWLVIDVCGNGMRFFFGF